jgi:hypothetical protein
VPTSHHHRGILWCHPWLRLRRHPRLRPWHHLLGRRSTHCRLQPGHGARYTVTVYAHHRHRPWWPACHGCHWAWSRCRRFGTQRRHRFPNGLHTARPRAVRLHQQSRRGCRHRLVFWRSLLHHHHRGKGGGGGAATRRGIGEVPGGFVARATRGNGRVAASTTGSTRAPCGLEGRPARDPRPPPAVQLAAPATRATPRRGKGGGPAPARPHAPVHGHEPPAPARPYGGVAAPAPASCPSRPRAAHVRGPTRASTLVALTAPARALVLAAWPHGALPKVGP